MTTINHYREAEDALEAKPGSRASRQDLATAQLHATLAVADELRAIRNQLIDMRGSITGLLETRAERST